MTAVVVYVIARRRDATIAFAIAGALLGIAPQFRPNLILVPALLAAYAAIERRTRRRLVQAAVLGICSAAALAPWVVRNYALTGLVLPTSVHGGVQLWYGTLQVGPYLHSRAYNPRSVFEAPVFDYTSLADVPLLVSARIHPCIERPPTAVTLVYWTDRDITRRRVDSGPSAAIETAIAAPHSPAVVYYALESHCPEDVTAEPHRLPRFGEDTPFVFFVSDDHLGDMDVHQDLLDIFDLARMMARQAWGVPVAAADRLSAAGIMSLADAVNALTPPGVNGPVSLPAPRFASTDDLATLTLADGSTIGVPRGWSGGITDVAFNGPSALAMMHASSSFAELRLRRAHGESIAGVARNVRDDVGIDREFYRVEPHMMRRYSALAFDNIRRAPGAFLAASAYRAFRLFVVEGTGDVHTAQQFSRSRTLYLAATVLSAGYFALFVAGVVIGWRAKYAIALPLVLILYVPVTICAVLTNMRYTVTVQPIVFVFVAVAITAAADAIRPHRARAAAGSGPAET
jgi:hypothetical protein